MDTLGEQYPLYSTFITSEEILNWFAHDGTILTRLVDEAYDRWMEEDKELADLHADCWVGYVHARPGGYYVWLEVEQGTAPSHKINIPIDTVQRCRNFIAELRRIGGRTDRLTVAEMPILTSLDDRVSGILEKLANELISLLVDNGLARPLVEEINGSPTQIPYPDTSVWAIRDRTKHE